MTKRRTKRVTIQPEMKSLTWTFVLPDSSEWEVTLVRKSGAAGLRSVWRKVHVGLITAFAYGVKEWQMMRVPRKFKVDWAARRITFTLKHGR